MTMSQIDQAVNLLYRVKLAHEAHIARSPGARETQFLGACADMIQKRGAVTYNMQTWLNQILERHERPVSEESIALAASLEDAATRVGTMGGFLRDIAERLRSNQTINDWQREAALKVRENAWDRELGEGERYAMSHTHGVQQCYSMTYMADHYGRFQRAQVIMQAFAENGTITWAEWMDITSTMGRLRELAEPKFSKGDLVFVAGSNSGPFIILDLPIPHNGQICYPALSPNGTRDMVVASNLRKRAPRG